MNLKSAPSDEEIVRLFHEGMLGPELANRFEQGDDEDASLLQRCIALHNQGDIDLVSLPSQPSFAGIDRTSFFTVQQFFCRAIPGLKTNAKALMECCRILVDQAGNDGVANEPNRAFQVWCANNPDERDAVIGRARDGDPTSMHFVTFALRALNDADIAIDFINTYPDERRLFGMAGLGGMSFSDENTIQRAIAALKLYLSAEIDDRVRTNAAVGAFEVLGRAPNAETAAELVKLAADQPGDEMRHALARILWSHRRLLTSDAVEQILKALHRINPEHGGALGTIDIALRPLLGSSDESLAEKYLTEVLQNEKLSLDNFSTTAHELAHGDRQRLYEWSVRWLLSGSIGVCKSVTKLVNLGKDQPFDAIAPPNLNTGQKVFLCFKAIGFLFAKPVLCSSILVSVLRSGDAEAAEQAAKLLFDPMLINYGGGVKDYLKSIPKKDKSYGFIRTTLSNYEIYYSGLRAAGTISEIHPSNYQQDVVRQREQDLMSKAYKQAQSKSVFLNLVRRSTILYGKRTLTYVVDADGKQRPVAMDLKQMSTVFEMPRHEIIDPIGLELMTLALRVAVPK